MGLISNPDLNIKKSKESSATPRRSLLPRILRPHQIYCPPALYHNLGTTLSEIYTTASGVGFLWLCEKRISPLMIHYLRVDERCVEKYGCLHLANPPHRSWEIYMGTG